MSNGWQTKKLVDVSAAVSTGPFGSMLHKSDYSESGVPLVNPINIVEDRIVPDSSKRISKNTRRRLASYVLAEGDVVVARRGEIGRCAVVGPDEDGWICGTGSFYIRPLPSTNSQFLAHLIRSPRYRERLEKVSTGTTMKNLSNTSLRELVIEIPPPAEQKRIVGILDEAFDGIATAKANAEKNLQNARALFDNHLDAVFTVRGEGWRMERLDALTRLARGHNPPKSKFSREPKPGYVRFYQIRDGATDNHAVYVPDTPQLHKMKTDDIMMVAYRHVGRVFRGVEGAFNVALCKISNARRDLVDDDYLFHIIPSRYVKGELLKRSERSLIPSMSVEHLRELKIPLPPLSEQLQILEVIHSLSAETKRLEFIYQQKLAALEELKKSLLHEAFSGRL